MRLLLIVLAFIFSVTLSAQSSETVYDVVEQMPHFPGGEDSMRHFLLHHLQYPEYSKNHHIEGRVDVRFMVDEIGTISHIMIHKGEIRDINAEAIRVVRSFPPFEPGMHDGKAVNVTVILPIIFQLDESELKNKRK